MFNEYSRAEAIAERKALMDGKWAIISAIALLIGNPLPGQDRALSSLGETQVLSLEGLPMSIEKR
jgi:hypothetical protein